MKHPNLIFTAMMSLLVTVFATAPAFAGVDDLDNFFSPDELNEALGADADRLRTSGALTPSELDADSEDENEDADVTGAIEAKDFVQLARGGEGSPVWGPFVSNFRQCAPGCVPTNYNVYRRGRHTCHAQGRAIDVGAIICGGQTYAAINGGRFAQLVSCMQDKMVVLYREHRGRGKTKDHYDHAHFSIGCSI